MPSHPRKKKPKKRRLAYVQRYYGGSVGGDSTDPEPVRWVELSEIRKYPQQSAELVKN